jgi:hypothetical protein
MAWLFSKDSGLRGLIVVAMAGLLAAQSALAANYYIGNDAACGGDRITVALLAAALAGDPNPVFYISKSKPAENAEVSVAYGALQTAEFRGGYNSCQDAINGVSPTGRSSIHSNALATSANRRTIRVGSASNSPTVRFYDVIISGGRLDSTVIPTAYGAGLFVDYGTVQLFRSWVEGNWTNPANTQSRGGGVAVRGSGRFLSMDAGSVVRDNTAYDGGGIYCASNAQFLMEGSDIRENRAVRGGGLHVTSGCNAPLTSTSTTSGRIRNNDRIFNSANPESHRRGGGIYVGSNSLVQIIGTSARRFLVTGNENNKGGGAFVEGNSALLASSWATFDNNLGLVGGGGLGCFNTGADDAIVGDNIQITNNNGNIQRGGGVFVDSGCRARFHNGVTISGNVSGGVHAFASSADSSITILGGAQAANIQGNTANGGATALAQNGRVARVNLDNVVVSGNQSTQWGGGLYAEGQGAEIVMRRTLAGTACHSQFFCSDLSFNSLPAGVATQGAAAAARDAGFIEISGTYIEGNIGTAIRAQNLTFDNGGNIRVSSSVLVPAGNNRLVHAEQGRVGLYYNTLDYATSTASPVTLVSGDSFNRRSIFFGNLFNGSAAPLLSPNSSWFASGPNGGCSGFSQIHPGNDFFSSHPAARRYVGSLPLQSGTRLINDPVHPIIDFCDVILDGTPGDDILGNSRPFNTPNPNTHGTFDLGAHEIRTPPFYNLDASRTGQGSLDSSPTGINCPGTCNASFVEGTSVQVTATPATGWTFSHWDGNCSGTNPGCTVVMNANRVVVARFLQLFNLNVFLVGDGSVNIQPDNITCTSNCTETFPDGDTVTLTAMPGPGYNFAGWTGACTGTGTCSLSMTTNRSVAAEFVEQPTDDVIFHDRFQ